MANITLKNSSGGKTSVTADEFLGTSSYTKLLQLYDPSNGSSTSIGSWEPDLGYVTVYKQLWMNSNLNNDTGDLVLQLRNNGTGTELCMIIDGDYYSMGNKVLNAANFSSYALPLAGGAMNGTIWSAHVYPKTTMSYNFGSAEYEYNATFSRTIFVRHIEPAKNVNDDIYLNYGSRNGCVRVWSALSMEGVASIHNLPIGGGIFWNPYVESADDGTDAASITLHAGGVGGGTELRITMANDGDDVINLNPASWVYLKGKAAFRVDDSWLRINETGGFASGIYCGGSILRTDNVLQVGSNGSAFYALSDGRLYCSYHAQIGSSLSMWTDNEGGNINIKSGNGHTNSWEIDSYNGDLRICTWREADGEFRSNTLHQTDGFWDNAYYASQASLLSSSDCGTLAFGAGDHFLYSNNRPNARLHFGIDTLYQHRGGAYHVLLDSGNYTSYCAPASHSHSYLPLSGGNMSGRIRFDNLGSNYIGNGSSDGGWTVGGTLGNLVFSSWYSISFTTECATAYQGVTSIGFDVRNSAMTARRIYATGWLESDNWGSGDPNTTSPPGTGTTGALYFRI